MYVVALVGYAELDLELRFMFEFVFVLALVFSLKRPKLPRFCCTGRELKKDPKPLDPPPPPPPPLKADCIKLPTWPDKAFWNPENKLSKVPAGFFVVYRVVGRVIEDPPL